MRRALAGKPRSISARPEAAGADATRVSSGANCKPDAVRLSGTVAETVWLLYGRDRCRDGGATFVHKSSPDPGFGGGLEPIG